MTSLVNKSADWSPPNYLKILDFFATNNLKKSLRTARIDESVLHNFPR